MRGAKATIVAIFLLMLVLPALQMATSAVPIAPLDENRRLAELPSVAALASPAAYVEGLQKWFADHYGFRELLIRSKTQLDYSLFRSSDRVHIGSDGFLFYRTVIDKEEPRIEAMTDDEVEGVARTFGKLRDWAAARGIHLIVQTQQLKDKFYPENLPREAAFARTRHRFDDIRARLAAVPGITFIDTTPILAALKAQRPVFHRTDFHWNDPAAFALAQHLVDTIAAREGRPIPFWHIPLKIVERKFSGGQATFLPLFRPPEETSLFVEQTWDESGFPRDTGTKPFEFISTARQPDPVRLLPTTVIFGDSFTDGMVRSGLVTQFNKLTYSRLMRVELADVLNAMPADAKYLVIEFIETAVPIWPYVKIPE